MDGRRRVVTLGRMSIGDLTEGEAREALERYEPIVRRQAARSIAVVRHRAIDVDDLRAEGRIAVLEAVASYEDYGVSERNWVWQRVRQRIIDTTRRLAPFTRDELRMLIHHSTGELSAELENKGRALAARRFRSLDAPVGDGSPFVECLEDPDAMSAERDVLLGQRRRLLRQAIDELRPRHAAVIRARFLEDLSQRETGELLGISESRVSQIQYRAMTTLIGKIQAALENSSANFEMQTNVPAPSTEAQPAFSSPSTTLPNRASARRVRDAAV